MPHFLLSYSNVVSMITLYNSLMSTAQCMRVPQDAVVDVRCTTFIILKEANFPAE